MPSTLVHVAVGGIVGAALLAAEFDRRSVAVVLVAAAVPDLDTFTGIYLLGTHRALLHTFVLPAAVGGVLLYDARARPRSIVRDRWGARGVRVAGVALLSLLFGGILPDLMTNGVNVLYPLHDQFYTVDGELLLSNQRGLVQTFVELSPPEQPRTTGNTHYWTGVDVARGEEPESVERVFPVVRSGLQLLVVLLGALTVGGRLLESERRD
ncbi:metal-dependent hydrolase [Haloplanus sp. GCM10025708]|uniref:metal-dependent hydrolase n=1 Tax=Haloferacaceae TaxID=1644056 RepID=UPI00361CEF76